MFSQLIGAIVRAILVVLLIAMPAMLLPERPSHSNEIIALVALFAALFTFVEYNAKSPSLVEFRDAPPFNRIRFIALYLTVFVLSVSANVTESSSTLALLLDAIGRNLAELLDFPYSPVRLMVLMLPSDAPVDLADRVRTAAGLSYFVSLLSLATFVAFIRMNKWPRQSNSFNVWTNLPIFDPTAGGDVVNRLQRDASVNLILGFLLPFLIPALVKLATDILNPITLMDPQVRIWTTTAWAFLPSSLLMRGIALSRIANLIVEKRRASFHAEKAELQPA